MPDNRIGSHAGVWGFGWTPAASERAIAGAAQADFDLIEVPAIDRDAFDSSETRELLARLAEASGAGSVAA